MHIIMTGLLWSYGRIVFLQSAYTTGFGAPEPALECFRGSIFCRDGAHLVKVQTALLIDKSADILSRVNEGNSYLAVFPRVLDYDADIRACLVP